MHRYTLWLLCLSICCWNSRAASGSNSPTREGGGIFNLLPTAPEDELFRQLDSLVANRSDAVSIKRHRIDRYHDDLRKSRSPQDKYTACLHLYEEFDKFQFDSALRYSNRMEKWARRAGDPEKINAARLARSKTLIYLGMYKAAGDLLDGIRARGIHAAPADYYDNCQRLYHVMAQTAMPGDLQEEYKRLDKLYRDSILTTVGREQLLHVLMSHWKRADEQGDMHESIDELTGAFHRKDISINDRGTVAYTLADAYRRLGNAELYRCMLALAAIYDLATPTFEYSSLAQLSGVLFRENDLGRANRYITRTLEDATDCNAVNRILIASRMVTEINQAFQRKIDRHQRQLLTLLAIVTGILLLLTTILLVVLRQKSLIKQLQEQHAQDNERLRDFNARLGSINRQQETAAGELLRANYTKDKYLRHYMQLSTSYIDKLERYRVQLHKTALSHGMERLLRELRSATPIEQEYKSFFSESDTIFLSIYPDFVERVNALLREPEQLKSPTLNTEFRLLAVIRLGISGNAEIAQFLHISINTVYTYRNRLRNAARDSATDFEKQIMEIT